MKSIPAEIKILYDAALVKKGIPLPAHFHFVATNTVAADAMTVRLWLGTGLGFWMAAGTVGSVLLGVIVTACPLWIGLRAFRKLEF